MTKKSNPVMWVLMGLLIVALGGFGATNLGGSIRSIGSVGDVEIGVQQYANGLQREMRAIQAQTGSAMSFTQAQDLGVSDRVLAQLVAQAAFDAEAEEMNLSIGDENLRNEILAMPQFQGLDGNFDRDAYSFGLNNAGLTESQFEASVRAESARNLLEASIIAGIVAPKAYSQSLATYLGERRDVSWSLLDRSDITTGLPVADDATLQQFHSDNEALFTTPEAKRITYAWVTPEMIIDTVEVDEDTLRAAYDDAYDQFNQPERRLLERLVFGSKADLETAKARIESEEATFEDIVAERGLELVDVDIGDLDREALGDIADPIFNAGVGDVIGPLETSLGPAMFRVNAILSAQTTSFEDARPMLREEFASDRARRVVDQMIDTVDDLLVGGASVEDVAEETELELGSIDWHGGVSDGIAGYEAFRRAAAAVTESDYPEVVELDDGGIFALQLDEVIPPALQPFEEVRDAVEAAWTADTVVQALEELAEPLAKRLSNGESFEDVGLSIDGAQAMTRRTLHAETPAEFVQIVFEMEAGEARVIEGDGRIYVLKLDEISPPDADDADLQSLRSFLENQAASGISQDLFNIVAEDFRARAGVDLDYTAINAVHANFN